MLIKIVLTAVVVVVWYMLFMANLMAAGRTAASMQARESVPFAQAQRRTTPLVLGWAVVISGLSVLALVKIS